MAGWSVTTYAVVMFASTGSQLASGFTWAASQGGGGAWMGTSKWFALPPTAIFRLLAWLVNMHGLRLAKWLSDSCALLPVATILVLLCLLVKAPLMGSHTLKDRERI